MKRKYSHIVLAILLLVSTSGFTVNTHFCGEELQSLTINTPAERCSDPYQMPEGCCHDEFQQYTVDDYQVQQTDFSHNTLGPVLFTLQYFVLVNTSSLSTVDQLLLTSKLLPPAESKIFIKVQSFLI